MTDGAAAERSFKIVRNGDPEPAVASWSTDLAGVQKHIADALNARNVAFLLGAGCSSLRSAGQELGISTMMPLAQQFCDTTHQTIAAAKQAAEDAGWEDPASDGEDPAAWDLDEDIADDPVVSSEAPPHPGLAPAWALSAHELSFLESYGIALDEENARNLERLMEVLHATRFVLRRSNRSPDWTAADRLTLIIDKVQRFIWEKCTKGAFARPPGETSDTKVRDLYEQFYRKLVLRDRSLPRTWVFTTNYDLFSETAMDRLAIPYSNGFSGVVERRFNPATFRYALAEQLDISSRKWSAVDAFVYLCKLHGSISWTEDDHGLFPIRERVPAEEGTKMMIFPTPAKQNSSLGSPYSDLFREFQGRIVQEQSVLITLGYAFGDEHLNNIIYQALTIPTFRLIIFFNPTAKGEIAKLRALGDPRITIIGGDGPAPDAPAHYFATVVDKFMPQRASERIDEAVRKVIQSMAPDRDAGA